MSGSNRKNPYNLKDMKKLLYTIIGLVLLDLFSVNAQEMTENISIIPQPANLQELSGYFDITNKTRIRIDPGNPELEILGGMLADQLEFVSGYEIAVVKKKGALKNAFNLSMQPSDTLGMEGYSLSVGRDGILLKAPRGKGIFYGLQTIYQLLPTKTDLLKTKSDISIPSVNIVDEPRFSWRGMMLDVGRYFYPVPFIKKFLDYLAMHKMNVFHWHLTEDHGWRIEIEKYPKLTEIGAWRSGTQITPGGRIDHNLHGGFYTQDQIREVVAYAKKLYITVVPEIEMPGHSFAALVAYPELSCTGGPFKMPIRWGIQEDMFCPSETTFNFLEDVLTEVMELFPSKYIHIGGDEAPKTAWKKSELAQQVIKREGLANEHELQSYFIRRIEKFLNKHGRQIIGWDEILEGGLAPNAAVMSWRGTKGGIAAAKEHHNVVMSPTDHMYFDYYQGDPTLEPFAIAGGPIVNLKKVYSYEPVPKELSSKEAPYIIGVQGNIWSEFIHSPEKVEYMGFPRGAALSEVAWTQPELKNWDSFKRRMEALYKHYDALGMNYAKSAYNVRQEVSVDTKAKNATVFFSTDSYEPQIHYTLDGSEPTTKSLGYRKPFKVDKPMIIQAAVFENGKRKADISTQYINDKTFENNVEVNK